jgi:hypothetical protein
MSLVVEVAAESSADRPVEQFLSGRFAAAEFRPSTIGGTAANPDVRSFWWCKRNSS